MRSQTGQRTIIDWLGVAGTTLVLLSFAGVALYGMASGFTATKAYEAANLWVGLGCALLAGLCSLYLMVEIVPPANLRIALFFPVICAFAGYYVTIAGIPTIVVQLTGQRGSVDFSVVEAGMPWGTRSCNYSMRATNPDYAELRLCVDRLEPRPREGDRVRVEGNISDWGITTDVVTVLP